MQTDITNKQCQKLGNTYEFDKKNKKGKVALNKYNRTNLVYGSKYSFYPYYQINSFNGLPLALSYPILRSFYDELNKFISLNPHTQKKNLEKKKKRLCIIICNYITCIWK